MDEAERQISNPELARAQMQSLTAGYNAPFGGAMRIFARRKPGAVSEKGASLTEYCLLIALIAVVTMASISQVQEQISLTFWKVSDATQGDPGLDPGGDSLSPGDAAGRPAGTEGQAP